MRWICDVCFSRLWQRKESIIFSKYFCFDASYCYICKWYISIDFKNSNRILSIKREKLIIKTRIYKLKDPLWKYLNLIIFYRFTIYYFEYWRIFKESPFYLKKFCIIIYVLLIQWEPYKDRQTFCARPCTVMISFLPGFNVYAMFNNDERKK